MIKEYAFDLKSFFEWEKQRQLYAQQTCGLIINIKHQVTGSQSEFFLIDRQILMDHLDQKNLTADWHLFT